MKEYRKLKNVIVVCDFGYIEGGASRVAHESAIELSKDFNVTLFCAVGPISKELEESKVNVQCLGQSDILNNKNRISAFLQGIWNGKAKKEFSGLLDKFSAIDTIIHVHTWTKGVSSSIFKIAENKKFEVLLTVHDYFLVCPNGGLYNYQKHMICEREPLSCKCICTNCDSRSYAHKIFRICRQVVQNNFIRKRKNISYIFISNFAKKQLLRRKPKIKKSYFLLNPINFENRFRVNCAENELYIYIGRLTDDKGIRIFCEGVTKAGVSAVVIGRGILEEELKNKYPNIEFVGWLDKKDMSQYIQKTRCLIFPSTYYEASPLTPLELMACGVPCIISDKNSSKELIMEEENGYLYNGYDADMLADKIKDSLDNKAIEKMSNKIYKTFDINKFSVEMHINSLIDIYNDVLK